MKVIQVFLLFLLMFNFRLPIVYNSAILSFLLVICIYIVTPKYNRSLTLVYRSKHVYQVIGLYFLLIPITVLSAGIIHETYDFGLIKSNILTLFIVITTVFLSPIIYQGCNFSAEERLQKLINIILIVFVIQTIIQLLAFIFPSIADVVHLFQKEEVSKKNYGGIRAIALTGNPFFDLSSGYGLTFILFIYNLTSKAIKKPFFIFIMLFIGSLFAGRTAFVGLLIGLVYYIFMQPKYIIIRISKVLIFILTLILLFAFFYFLLPQNIKDLLDDKLLPYAFEFYFRYLETGSFETESSNILIERMYFPISIETFLLGDGRYKGFDGSYYMNTDAGYMRNILFFGVFGFIYIYISNLIIFYKPYRTLMRWNGKLLLLTVFIYFLILHYKGEVLMFMPILQVVLILIYLNSIFYIEKKKNKV